MERTITGRALEKLARRAPLPVDPSRSIAIKRDVHVFEVGADARTFTRAFRDVMTDPAGAFGLIRVKRPADRVGRSFEPGERFQGCFSIERAALAAAAPGGRLARALAWLLARRTVARAAAFLEDLFLSDYGEIVELVLEPDAAGGEPARLRYRYLEGTPIAGSSTFIVEPLGPERCRVTQVLEFQEINGIALATFERFGLKYHDQVVHMQVHKAAARAGAPVLSGTIPDAYARLSGMDAELEAAATTAREAAAAPEPVEAAS